MFLDLNIGLAKSSFGFFCKMVRKKLEGTFWPNQYFYLLDTCLLNACRNE